MCPSRTAVTCILFGILLGSLAAAFWLRTYDAAFSCQGLAKPMMRIELAFGFGGAGGAEVSEEGWRAFLDAEVTPRFPDGLTVLSSAGQWRGKSGVITKEASRLLLIWVTPDRDTDRRVEDLRTIWKRQHGQESVLRAESRDCVSF